MGRQERRELRGAPEHLGFPYPRVAWFRMVGGGQAGWKLRQESMLQSQGSVLSALYKIEVI